MQGILTPYLLFIFELTQAKRHTSVTSVISKVLAYSSLLQRHKRIHTGEKPFACDQCEHKCDDISQLQRHKRNHTGEKPLVCDQCEYRTNRKNSLNSHKKMHTGEKPYECEKCDYKCSVSTRFLRHMRVIHKVEKPFKCDLCEYKAKKLHGLTDHKRKRK